MDTPISIYLGALFLTLTMLTQHVYHKLQHLPPSPFPSLPLIGHLYLLKKPFHRSLQKLSDRYGPVLFLWFGSRPVLLVTSPAAAEDCFTKNDIIFANRPRLLLGKLLGYNYTSLAWAPYGDHWRNLRRITSLELLSSHRLQMFSHIRVDEVQSLIRRLFQASTEDPDRTIDLQSAFFELMFNVLMRMIAGKRYYGKDVAHTEEAKRFQDIVLEVSRVGAASTVGDFLPIMRWFGNKGAEKLMEIHEKRDGFMQDLIQGQRESKFDASSQGREKTMIEVLLSLHETEPENYSDEIIRGLVVVLFQAGADTSVGTMEWAMSHLLNNPKILKKAQTEIDNHVGHIRLIAESDVGELPYLNCIIKETLRMNPPAPFLVPHESSEECTIGGYRIPRGTMLMVNVWGIQNDPKFWVDPEKFMPERFEGPRGTKNGFKWMPFGSGRRGCPGENLAIRMVGLAVGSLLQCFDWERIGKELVDMTEGTAATMSKAAPLMATCRPREAAASLLSPF